MNKSLKWFLVTIGIVLVAGLVFYLLSDTTPDAETTNSSTSNTNKTNTTNTATNQATNNSSNDDTEGDEDGSPAAGATTRVSAIASGFVPSEVTISVGDTVTWKNDSSVTVYVAPNDHPSHVAYAGVWDDDGSGEIAPGEEYSFMFSEAGTFDYHNHEDESQTGTVIVE